MKLRQLLIGTLLALSGCADYDYMGTHSGDYYRGAAPVHYVYGPGYGYADGIGLFDYPVYPIYRGGYYPQYWPPPRLDRRAPNSPPRRPESPRPAWSKDQAHPPIYRKGVPPTARPPGAQW